jgi:hypothetical protein
MDGSPRISNVGAVRRRIVLAGGPSCPKTPVWADRPASPNVAKPSYQTAF